MTSITEGTDVRGQEVVQIRDVGDEYEVETTYDGRAPASKDGPAMVNSSAFRAGYDRIFGREAN